MTMILKDTENKMSWIKTNIYLHSIETNLQKRPFASDEHMHMLLAISSIYYGTATVIHFFES